MRFLVIKLNHLGDNVVFLPAVQALRKRFPDWKLTIVTTPAERILYENLAPADELLTCPQPRFNSSWRRPWELAAWWARLLKRWPDACLISFDQGNVAHLLGHLSGASLRVGGALASTRVPRSLTHNVPPPASGWVAEWNWEIARTLAREAGGIQLSAKPPPPNLYHLLANTPKPSSRPLIVIHAGASSNFTRWPMDRFAVVGARLARDHDVVWIDRPETAAAKLAPTIRRFAPKTLQALVTVLVRADLFLGNNSGPMHLANALGRRGVVVTGSTARGWDPYWYRERWTVLRHPALPCQPCEQITRRPTACAHTADPFACLSYWTADTVEAACRASLACPPFPKS
jgi:ADP-heptose:LPS heptosyltransferase